jgi:SusD/RagB-like outer membrane lipoprotein
MRKTYSALAIVILSLSAGCSDFLDVNTNPNGPQSVSANLYLPPMLHWLVTSPQFDGRFVGHYTQEWYSTTTNASPPTTWGKMGYDPGSDNGAQQWRDVYWSLGQNLIDMNNKATAEERWDLLGVGLILKAWGWQVLTDLHGEIIVKEAIDQTRTSFDYDTQDYAYQEVQRLLDSAIVLLKRTDGAVDRNYLAVGDKIYGGDRTKWLKLAYGMLALNLNHYSNKASYNAARVIALVDSSFASNADDAVLGYPCTSTDFADCNFWGITRNNITLYRQTQFVVGLMNGTQFGGTVDPRMTRMLALDSANTTYRGLDPNVGQFGALTVPQRPRNFFGYVALPAAGSPSRYIFADRSKIPVMTYAELQFIKAEAALRNGDQPTALTAYTNGIRSHFQFVNDRSTEAGNPATITTATRDSFLASPNIVPATLTLSHIMSQKYIALWGWGHNELWMDMRRYHYIDLDGVSGTQVFRGFVPILLANLYPGNVGKLVQRIRPRFNSEYVWNRAGLDAVGGLADDYHIKDLWITQP